VFLTITSSLDRRTFYFKNSATNFSKIRQLCRPNSHLTPTPLRIFAPPFADSALQKFQHQEEAMNAEEEHLHLIDATKPSKTNQPSPTLPEVQLKKHLKIAEINYRRNTESSYTEKIQELDQNFNYSSNSDRYWGEAELSLLYGTPLYEAASPSQKLALNHLYWVGGYNIPAASETNTTLYNQISMSIAC
jgi:hypothetical protein